MSMLFIDIADADEIDRNRRRKESILMAADRRMMIETLLFMLIVLILKSFITFYALGFVLVSSYCVFVGCRKSKPSW
jgi:type IV secretory pathway TrbD component